MKRILSLILSLMQIGEGDIVPIEAGYDFYARAVIQWWENGEKIVFTLAAG